jgi:hypothetical protein
MAMPGDPWWDPFSEWHSQPPAIYTNPNKPTRSYKENIKNDHKMYI